jgi:beta-glucosidase
MEETASHPQKAEDIIGQPFRWAAGIESSIIPHLNIDQYRWTQHDHFWRQDFVMAASSLKCRWLRYSVPWSTVQPEPGKWAWSWCDEHFDAAAALGIHLIVDLVHFGVPTWLPDAFGDLLFPDALESFARAFGRRYRGHPAIASICPINEPLTTAFFAGDAGLWPPHGTGLQTYMFVLSRIAQALSRAIKALRETMGSVEIIVCDSLEVAKTDEPDSSEKTSPHLTESLGADVARRMERRHVVMDLVLGRLNDRHPLYSWLLLHGFPLYDLNWFLRYPQQVDVIGLDYYHHTEVELYTTPEGYYRQRIARKPSGLFLSAQAYWQRYRLPFMVSETSATGADSAKLAWLQKCVNDVRRLRAAGFPCIGFTWWPLFDHLDWDGAMLHQTGHIHPVGIYSLRRTDQGELVREPTVLADHYRALIEQGDAPIGSVGPKRRQTRTPKVFIRAPRKSEPLQPPVVIYSPLLWDDFRGRPHHLAEQLAKDRRVLFVEPPRSSFDTSSEPRRIFPVEGCPFLEIFASPAPLPASLGQELELLIEELSLACSRIAFPLREAIHWVQHAPLGLMARKRYESSRMVFDILDGRGFESGGDARQLCEVADALVFRSQNLERRLADCGRGSRHVIADGVEVRHFLKATRLRTLVPHDSRFIQRPVLAYIGRIDEHLNLRLLERVAAETLNWNVLMVGPVSGISPQSLPRPQNIFWLGSRPYERLPNYLRGVDACILPMDRLVDLDGYMPSPIFEMLCAGRPVVTSPMRELADQKLAGVHVASSGADFLRACHQAVAPMTADARRGIIRQVLGLTWSRASKAAGDVLENLVHTKGL